MAYSILIVDDDRTFVEELKSALQWNRLRITEVYTAFSVREAIAFLSKTKADIVLCDIEMPGGNGLQLLKWIRENHASMECIVLSSYAEFSYAQSALRFDVCDYLLKPIDPEELTHAVDKAVQVVLRKQENKRMQNLLQNTQALDKQKKIALSVADKIEFVEIGSIIRCESESNYTTFYLKSGEKLIVSKTLKEFDELLAPYHFLRVHQSHLINLDEIKSFIKSDGGYIRMKDGASVSISRQRRNYVMEVLKQL